MVQNGTECYRMVINGTGWRRTPMYKRQVGRISFPTCFFSIKNLIWPPDPLNNGKIDFFIAFLSSLKLLLQENVQNPSKEAKNTAAGNNILS